MDDSTATFSPLPRSSLGGGGGLGVAGSGFRAPGLVGRPSVGGLLQDEDMSLALAGDDLDDDDDDEADADPFQRVPSATGRRHHPPSNAAEDQDDEPTLRLDSASTASAPSSSTRQAKSSADLFFGGSMAASTSKAGVPPLGAAPTMGLSASHHAASPTASRTSQGRQANATRASGSSTGPHPAGYEPDEDDVTDSALEARGYAPEELARIRSLRDERDGLRTMNGVLEDVLGALRQTAGKMENFQATIETSHQLLDLYTRVASQAEHTSNLLLDGEWHGVERDYQILAEREQAAREAEEAAQREAEERAAREEAERVRKAQEEQWRREQAALAASSRGGGAMGGTRGRGRGLRGSASSGTLRGSARAPAPPPASSLPPRTTMRSTASASPTNSGIPTRGSGSGIGRGGVTRGRGTGTTGVRGTARGRSSAS